MDSLNEQFSQIYDQYIEKIYRFVYLKVNSQETAEDITSKVFLKGWEAFKKQKTDIKNPGAFLYQIARNAVIDYYRGKGRLKTISVEVSAQLADPEINAQEKAILSADASILMVAIQKLKKDHQDIIIWHYLEDMEITDIADLLDKPAGTIRVALHRSLKELKEIIENS